MESSATKQSMLVKLERILLFYLDTLSTDLVLLSIILKIKISGKFQNMLTKKNKITSLVMTQPGQISEKISEILYPNGTLGLCMNFQLINIKFQILVLFLIFPYLRNQTFV